MMIIKQTTSLLGSPLSLLLGTLLLTITSQGAYAQSTYPDVAIDSEDDGKIGLSLGLNVMAVGSPYDTDEDTFKVLPSLFYDNGSVYARGSQAGAYLINDEQREFTAFIQPGGHDFDPDDANGDLKGLNKREISGMVGISYLQRTPVGGFRGRLATDVLDNSDGTTAQLAYLARLNVAGWTIYPSIGVEWADNTYNDYYYGVSNKESAKTGVSAYNSDSSFSPYVNVSATYDINDRWGLFLGQNVGYLADEQADSPMVDNRTTYRTTIGVLYEF